MSEQNKAITSRIPLEVFNQGRLEVVDELVSDDVVDHATPPPGVPSGKAGIKVLAQAARTAFPDLKLTINLSVAEGDLVVQHTTTTGTMKGDFAGMPASGKTATWDAIHITRVKDGKIVEHWAVQDNAGMLQQLGFMPTPEGAPAR